MLDILTGVDDIIERHLKITHIGTTQHRSRHLTSCRTLSDAQPTNFYSTTLVGEILNQIDANWIAAGRQTRSKENWRFKKQLKIAEHNPSKETQLERAIARVMPEAWVNQVPTASGLTDADDGKRSLDLVWQAASGRFEFIELKVESDNPLHAAMELLQ